MRYAQNGKKHGGSDEWRTPRRAYENLHREFTFTVDAAASAENALHSNFWTAETDALSQCWEGHTVFCNPPYSMCGEFLTKGKEADCGVFIIPARTQATYFLDHVFANPYCHEIRWCHRGMRFIPASGVTQTRQFNRAPLPVCIVVYRNESRTGEIRQTSICADTLLPLHVINAGSRRGRPTVYDWKTLDAVIRLWDSREAQTIAEMAERTSLPRSTLHRIIRRL
ncbi:DNA N-6-adenine-methyltransferase [Serratia plymuthica]|uniref:DNA N-6-adenine-methyltransferase n=1 Tax=Serratia plymuthica TaxID=82996 RepID=UPI00055FB1AB|nr:DNA N-6-adenine-methyltransferase [Serratia plymuthica]ANJ96160.1 adenine methyltransferase [Serratia plymuthica]